MTKEQKIIEVEKISNILSDNNIIYLADLAGLNSVRTQELRASCFNKGIKLEVLKNSLLKLAMEKSEKDFKDLYPTLKNNTAVLTSEVPSLPAKIIKSIRNNSETPLLKGAWIDNNVYIGDSMLDTLIAIKSKNELIADIVLLLNSPIRNIISGLSNKKEDSKSE